ncbi:riboflavin kinase / FMN adenylyltransferase [Muriicola jejuensis]|uniref:Riboflavin biosynthesis protein n=1 Tax=Muriicola jejuensis TaxID=504488 RepID=A0A6P0UAN4_9FLAO|nr:bifunctional riboflavin kinase/FAD synthetase [Muriicola jejuensis]NER09642.1 bifunctional riboflavin kinase/FAD synthetase [Muriicola jejuensis]SMP07153.1 riboflavin kinase / FMN adenylyltransferase [Muriicola jejuensis]
MITVQSISKYDKNQASVITIGTFDGVHIGHRLILERLINDARMNKRVAIVLTFFPHPRMVLQKDTDLKLLNTIEEKKQILDSLGIDYLIIQPFTKTFSRLSATAFVRDVLVNALHTKKVIIGYDHRFGRNRNANINDLIAFGNALDFEVEEIPAQEIEAVAVSSTKIRNALLQGDVATANAYLGYDFMLTGKVIKGKGLGKQLGYPTANLKIEESYKLIPKNGVYVVRSTLMGRTVHGMMNIGYNPTVNGQEHGIEVHFFDLDTDLYHQTIQVHILEWIREEQKFNSLDDLKDQLSRDTESAKRIISG